MPKIIDLHCDTLMYCVKGAPNVYGEIGDGNVDLYTLDANINVQKLIKGGSLAQVFAIYIPRAAEYPGFNMNPYEYYLAAHARFNELLKENAAYLRPALNCEDIIKNEKEGFISAILSVEDADPLDGKMERLYDMYRDGVRMIGPLHNVINCIGYPQRPDPEEHKRGLKPFGIDAIREMERLGIVIDVSHMSEGCFWDTLKYTRGPIIASHSCCSAIARRSRNLTDEQIKALAERGGICGVNFANGLLHAGDGPSLISEVIAHMDRIRNLGGIDMVAFGSDFDGIGCELEWNDYAGMPMIVKAMEEKFTESEIEKICHGNAMRVFKEILK